MRPSPLVSGPDELHHAMIVGVIAVPVMQMPVMHEIHVIAVLDGHMLLARMSMRMIVGGDSRHKFLRIGIGIAHFDHMLIDMAAMRVVQVPVMQVIDMAGVIDGLMAAVLGMGVAIVPAMEHLMRHYRRGNQGKRQQSAVQGSMHDCALHK